MMKMEVEKPATRGSILRSGLSTCKPSTIYIHLFFLVYWKRAPQGTGKGCIKPTQRKKVSILRSSDQGRKPWIL